MLRRSTATTRRTLEAQLAAARHALRARSDLTVESSPDISDEAQLRSVHETLVQAINSGAKTSREIAEALRRVDEGAYGICERCDEPIPPKRLQAIPWATCCIRCQEELEAGESPADFPGS